MKNPFKQLPIAQSPSVIAANTSARATRLDRLVDALHALDVWQNKISDVYTSDYYFRQLRNDLDAKITTETVALIKAGKKFA